MKSELFNDFFELLLYLLLAVVVVYFVPSPFNILLFLLVLPAAWYSKKDYIWLAFFFLLEDYPGGFFSGGERDNFYRIPIYTLFSGLSFTIRELYLILLLVKAFLKKRHIVNFKKPFFHKELNLIRLLFLLLIIITPIVGSSYDSYRNIIKIGVNLTLFYSIFYIVPNRDTFHKFVLALFPFTFIAILLQIYSLTFNQQLVALFQSDLVSAQGVFDLENTGDVLQRPIELVHIILINFTSTFLIINNNKFKVNSSYLWLINVLSFISILFTATRTWFIALIVGYLFFAILSRNSSRTLFRYFAMFFFIVLVGFFIPALNKQISSAWERISTIELILNGDISAGGTVIRYDTRAPAVIEAFNESTVLFGAAFGDLHQVHQDFHVGYHNLLLNVGVLGALLFLYFILKLLFISLSRIGTDKDSPIASIALLIILVLNAGTQFIGFNVQLTSRFFLQAYILLLFAIAHQSDRSTNKFRQN